LKDPLFKEFKRIFDALFTNNNNIEILLKNASELIKIGMKDFDYNYAAFHYRSSLLKEGRDSPFSFSKKELLSNVIELKPESWKYNDDDWIHAFLSSLLNTYLYIFGRDTSFSENCILWTEQRRKPPNGKKPQEEEASKLSPQTLNVQSVSLTINLANNDTGLPSPPNIRLIIPPQYYRYLTMNGQIPRLLIKQVKKAIEIKPEQGSSEDSILREIGEFRKIFHYLEHPENNERAFSLLKKRGLEVAMYFLLMEKNPSLIIDAAEKFYRFVDPDKAGKRIPEWPYPEEDLQFFFRVIQAACVFTDLLGESMTVFPFQCYSTVDPITENRTRIAARAAIQNMNSWKDESPMEDDPKKRDFCSALTTYSQIDNLEGHIEQTRRILFSLMILSFFASRSGAIINSSDINIEKSRRLLTYFFNDEHIDAIKEKLCVTLDPKKIHWPIIALASADCLRGAKHEGKPLSINIAIGSDVEFREVLAPIYSINIADSKGIPKYGEHPKFLECFQNKLRSFVRRNFSLIEQQYRFICIKIGYDGTVVLYYISDLREEYHESTFSEIIKRIIPKTGLTIARVDAFGKATIFSRDVDESHRLIFRSSSYGNWQMPLLNMVDKYQIKLSDLIEEIKTLRKTNEIENQNWERFIKNILAPTIEQVSENPFAGGIIILFHDKHQFKEKHFDMPEGAANIELFPADNLEFVDLDTFKRLIIQDGATIINIETGKISSRIQLAAKGFDKLNEFMTKVESGYIKRKAAEWGIRHLSVLHFMASFLNDHDEERKPEKDVYCFIISQDGDVHIMKNKKEELCKSVVMG